MAPTDTLLQSDEMKLRILHVLKKHKLVSIDRLKKEACIVNRRSVKRALRFLTHKDINLVTVRDAKDNRGTKLVSLTK